MKVAVAVAGRFVVQNVGGRGGPATVAVPLRGTLHRCRSQRQHHRVENERRVCYASASLVLLPVMHNECPRHALSIQ